MEFEDALPIIDEILRKRRVRWYLPTNDITYEDACQKIRVHLHKKWDKYDQSKPLEPWINTVVTNQIRNITRNSLRNLQKPCDGCPFDISNDSDSEGATCAHTESGQQTSECALYKKWEMSKKPGYEIKTAASLDVSLEYGYEPVDNSKDMEAGLAKITSLLEENLDEQDFLAFKLIFLEELENEEVAEKLGEGTGHNQQKLYKIISSYKKRIKEKALILVRDRELFV